MSLYYAKVNSNRDYGANSRSNISRVRFRITGNSALLQASRQIAGQNLCLVRQPLGSGEIRFARILGLLHEILNMAYSVLLFVAQIPAAD